MKQIYTALACLAALLGSATACTENEMEVYQNDPAIYFNHEDADSIAYSFFTLDSHIPRDTVWVEALTMGMPSDQSRPFSLVQANSGDADAAQPGVHYVPFDDAEVRDSICISAGEVSRLIPVILLRDESLKAATYKLVLAVQGNEYFRPGIDAWRTYTVTIRTCNDYDTRVDYDVLTNANITPAFNNPLDAHCNAVRCFGFTANRDGWILYVEEPDKHPWLEISFSPQYRPHIAGKTYYDADGQPLDEQMIAATRFEGTGSPLTKYFYIHTDEYIPANGNADESWNNTTDENAWRTGYVVLYDKGNKSSYRLEVKQRPAQVVKMPIKNLLGQTTGYNEYYVEYELEQKNLTWGFLKYGANPVMTGMINDRWDGLSNTRKLYQEAIKAGDVTETVDDADGKIYRGAYNGYYTIEDDYPWQKDDVAAVINQIPDDHMIKYVLSKNRDRNGNGYIDYDEIVWYVPALDELAELRRVLDAGHMAFQNSEDRFHSSTPYLAGYTDEVPGRAFYVKMGDGETAFAMRDRQYNIICCRRKGAWLGNPDAGYEGGVKVDDTWDEEGEENIIMPKGN